MKRCVVLTVLLIVILFNFQLGFAQTSKDIKILKEDVKELKEQQKAIQKDLQDIKNLLKARQQAPAPAAAAAFKEEIINIEGAPFKGDNKAKIALIEFSDYQ